MRHNKKKGLKLGTDASHTKAMKKSLAKALFENDRIKTTETRAKALRSYAEPIINDRIKTTETRAKALRSYAEPIITWAKKGDLHSRRLAIAKLGDKNLVAEIFDKAAQGMWADRNGGYTRIMKLGPRKGDCAEMVIIEIVSEPCTPKPRKGDCAEMVIIEIVSEPCTPKAKKAAPAKKAAAPKVVEAEEAAEVVETEAAEAPAEESAE